MNFQEKKTYPPPPPPKFNITPENQWLEDVSLFRGHVSFPGCTLPDTNSKSASEKLAEGPKRGSWSSTTIHFAGENSLLVFGGVYIPSQLAPKTWKLHEKAKKNRWILAPPLWTSVTTILEEKERGDVWFKKIPRIPQTAFEAKKLMCLVNVSPFPYLGVTFRFHGMKSYSYIW